MCRLSTPFALVEVSAAQLIMVGRIHTIYWRVPIRDRMLCGAPHLWRRIVLEGVVANLHALYHRLLMLPLRVICLSIRGRIRSYQPVEGAATTEGKAREYAKLSYKRAVGIHGRDV